MPVQSRRERQTASSPTAVSAMWSSRLAGFRFLVLYEAFEPAEAKALWDRSEFVQTPKHGSWLNVTEVGLTVMIRQCLNRRIDSIDTLRAEVAACRRRETESEPRSTGNSLRTTHVSR